MPIRGSKTLEVLGWSGVGLRTDTTDLSNSELAAASNIDLHTRIAIAAQRQGKEKSFTSAPDASWAVTDGGDQADMLGGLVQRLTRKRGVGDSTPLGLNRWEDRLLAGETFLPDDAGAKGTYGWEVDNHKAQSQALLNPDVRRITHRGMTRYQIAGKHAYRGQKRIQDYRKLECSTNDLTQFVNYRPLLDNVEWTFVADRGQMIKDDGTRTYRWGIAPPPASPGGGRFNCDVDFQHAITYIRYTVETTPKVAHESNPTNCLTYGAAAAQLSGLSGFVELIEHPEDPQVTGIGIYRTTVDGGTKLLVRRVPIPLFPSYSITYGWEAVIYFDASLPSSWFDVTGVWDNRYFTTGDELRFQHAIPICKPHVNFADSTDTDTNGDLNKMYVPPIYMGTQQWEPGFAASTSDTTFGSATVTANPPYDPWFFIQNSEDTPQDGSAITYATQGRHGTHRWEVDEDFVTQHQRLRWAYGDITQDGSLGAAVETDNAVPPDSHYAAEHLGFVFLFGDKDNEHFLYWSKRFQPESWPAANFIEVGAPSDKSRGLASLAGLLGIFTENTKYRLTGSDSGSFVYQEALSSRGCPAPLTLVASERGLLFTAFDGVWQTTLTSPDQELSVNILPLFMEQTVNGMKPIDWNYAMRMSAEYHKNRYYLSYVAKGSSEIDSVAVYSFDTQQWSFYALDARSFEWEDTHNQLLYGATDGHVYEIEGGEATDDGLPISFSFRTKDFGVRADENLPGNFIRCLWLFLKLDMEITEGSATIKVYANDMLVHTTTIEGTRKVGLLHLPDNTWGTRCRVEVSGISHGPVRAQGLSLAYLPLEHD